MGITPKPKVLLLLPNPVKCDPDVGGFCGEFFLSDGGRWEAGACIWAETPAEAKALAREIAIRCSVECWGVQPVGS